MNIKKLDTLDPRVPNWGSADFKQRACPFCYSNESIDFVYRPDNLMVNKCLKCDCFYLKNAPSEDSLNKFYKDYSKNHYNKSISKFSKIPDTNALINSYPIKKLKSKLGGSWQNKKILDYGCGRGELITHLNSNGASAIGVDIDDTAIKSAELNSFDLYTDLSELPKDSFFDAAILFDFVEHPIGIRNILEDIAKYINEDGFILIWTPSAFDVIDNEIDSMEVFRYTLEHMQYLSSKTCVEIANFLNFKIDHIETRGFPTSVEEYKRSNIFLTKLIIKGFIKKLIPKFIKDYRSKIRNNFDSSGNYHLFFILKK